MRSRCSSLGLQQPAGLHCSSSQVRQVGKAATADGAEYDWIISDRSPCFVDSLFKAWGGRGGLSFNEVVEISSYFKLILYFHIASREGGLSFSELVKIDGNLGKIVFGVHGQFPFRQFFP